MIIKIQEHFYRNLLLYLIIGLFFSIGFNTSVTKSVAVTQFSINNGAENLSIPYTIAGFTFFTLAALVTFSITRYSTLLIQMILFIFFSGIMFLNSFLSGYLNGLEINPVLGYGFLFVSTKTIIELSESLMWLVPAAVFPTQKIKKCFFFIAASYKLGVFSGALLIRVFANLATPAEFLFFCACLMGLAAFFLGMIYRYNWHVEEDEEEVDGNLSEFFEFLSKSRYWVTILSVVMFVHICFFSCEYSFNVVSEYNFPEQNSLLSYFASFTLFETITSTLFSLFCYKLIMKWLGVWNTVNLVPVLYACMFFAYYSLGKNVYASSVIGIMNIVIVEYFLALFIIVFKAVARKFSHLIISFSSTVGLFVGMVLAGLLTLIYKQGYVDFQLFSLLLAVYAAGVGLFAFTAKSSYTLALSHGIAIRELQQMQEENFKLPVVQNALMSLWKEEDPDAKMLGLQVPVVVEDPFVIRYYVKVLEGIHDPDPDVRITALNSCLGFKNVIDTLYESIFKKFDDPEPLVRLKALQLLGSGSDIDLDPYDYVIQDLVETEKDELKKELAATIALLCENGHFHYRNYQFLMMEFLEDSNFEVRLAALKSLKQILKNNPKELASVLLFHLNDKEAQVSDIVIHTLEGLKEYIDFDSLDLFTRDVWLWKNTVKLLKHMEYRKKKEEVEKSAIENMYRLFHQLLSIQTLKGKGDHESISLLISYLKDNNLTILETAINAAFFDLYGDDSQTKYVFKHLLQTSGSKRNNAIEMLEHLGDPEIVEMISPFFEQSQEQRRKKCYTMLSSRGYQSKLGGVFEELLIEQNEWIRASAIYSMQFFHKTSSLPILEDRAQNDPSDVVRDVAAYLKNEFEGISCETPQMRELEPSLKLIENIVFLKESDLFRPLSLGDIAAMMKKIKTKKFLVGEWIFTPEQPLDGIYLIKEGQIDIIASEKNVRLSLGPKRTIGLISYFVPHWAFDRGEVSSNAVVYYLSFSDLKKFLEVWPQLREGIITILCKIVEQYE